MYSADKMNHESCVMESMRDQVNPAKELVKYARPTNQNVQETHSGDLGEGWWEGLEPRGWSAVWKTGVDDLWSR